MSSYNLKKCRSARICRNASKRKQSQQPLGNSRDGSDNEFEAYPPDHDPLLHSQAVGKLIQAALLLSRCGLDVCVAIAAPKRVQFWASPEWRNDLRGAMRKATNSQAYLDKENVDVEMFVKCKPESDEYNPNLKDSLFEPYTPAETHQPKSCLISPPEERISTSESVTAAWSEHLMGIDKFIQEEVGCDRELNIKPGTDTRFESNDEEIPSQSRVQEDSEQGNSSRNNDTRPADDIFKCDICDFTSTLRKHLFSHRRNSHKGDKFSCDQCDYKSLRRDRLTSHIRKHTGEELNCKHCNFKTTRTDVLYAHVRTHTGNTFICDLCGYQTPSGSHLHRHKKIHSGETYSCSLCNFTSNRNDNLRAHIRCRHRGQ